jgi:glycerol-3-phosphate dehydrogenase subunit B
LTDILIIGAGLSGLFASILASKRNADVALVAAGHGGLSISHGCIDVYAKAVPSRSIARIRKTHPYRITGKRALNDAIEAFEGITHDANYPFSGSLSQHQFIPTAIGALHCTSYAPASLGQSKINSGTPFAIGSIAGMRDFFPEMLNKHLRVNGYSVDRLIALPLPGPESRRDLYSTDIAHRFEGTAYRQQVARLWKPRISGINCLGIPAILGIRQSHQIFRSFQDLLGIELFEIPTLPPSLPGLRLEKILLNTAVKSGVNVIIGSSAIGRIDRDRKSKRVTGITLHTPDNSRQLNAERIILATGGFLHGGLVAHRDGSIQESVFNLSVDYPENREALLAPSLFDDQSYETHGVLVNSRMQPLDLKGEPVYENLFAAGGIIAGANRQSEGSRQGIDLATAQRAVEAALE